MDFLKKYGFAIAFIGVLLLGFGLRFYNFGPWLHFELDQARDARVADAAFEGSFPDLPLLGPKAGGTFLRLAPGFYYLQYLSGLVFGQDPVGIALFVAVFSFLSLPFFYLLMRRVFPRAESLGLTAVFAASVYVVLYGRFAWNPNLLVFFTIFGFYALLRAVDQQEAHRTRWFLLAAFSLALSTHFHFLAFLGVPTIVAAFLILKRARFTWKAWLGALLIAGVLYLPMVLNEIEAGWTNTQEFLGAITEKSSKENHNLIEKGIRNVSEYSQNGVVVLTGFEGSTLPAVIVQPDEFGTVCDAKCDRGKWYGVLGALFFLAGVLSFVGAWWRARDRQVSDFYLLAILWLGVSFMLFLPLSYGIAPRFYLLVTPLFFIMLGTLSAALRKRIGEKRYRALFWLIIGLLILSNLTFLHTRFSELGRAATENVNSAPDRILKEQIRVTLEQQQAVVAFFKERQEKTGYPIYMFSDPQYRRALKYLMERSGIQNDVLGFSGIYRQGEYYLVLRQRGDFESALRKYRTNYEVGEFRAFGTLMVIQMTPKPEAIAGERQDFSIVEKPADSKAPPRYTWREFFQRQNDDSLDKDDLLDESEDKEAN